MRTGAKYIILFSIVAAAIAGVSVSGPIPQNPSYHVFADQRTISAIPHFWNVITNVPFVVVGMMGMVLVSLGETPGGLPELRKEYFVFFLGIVATGLGSMCYHYHPTNATLLWDRLPMALTFMAFFSAIVGEHVSISISRKLFWPLIALGIISVLYWYATEQSGGGDLRWYVLVQYLPVLLIPILLLLFKPNLTPAIYLWVVCGSYVIAKIAESLDKQIFAAGYIVSGHSIKHLAAAFGAYVFTIALRKRTFV
jgi:hypothetical protein